MTSLASVIDSSLEKLKIAAELHGADVKFRSSTNDVIVGLFCVVIALQQPIGWINGISLGLGALSVLECYYLRWKRQSAIVEVSIWTLFAIAIWIGVIRLGLASDSFEVILFGCYGVGAAFVASKLWKSHSRYKRLSQEADPAAVTELKSLLEAVRAADPTVFPDASEYKIDDFLQGNQTWRLMRFEGWLLFVRSDRVFSRMAFATECLVIDKKEVRLAMSEIYWNDNVEMTLLIGADRRHIAEVSLEMARKIDRLIS